MFTIKWCLVSFGRTNLPSGESDHRRSCSVASNWAIHGNIKLCQILNNLCSSHSCLFCEAWTLLDQWGGASNEHMEVCAAPPLHWPASKLVVQGDVSGSGTFSTASPCSLTSIRCAQREPALICEENREALPTAGLYHNPPLTLVLA